MSFNLDLIRTLLLRLEGRQLSPRSTIIIAAEEEAEALKTDKSVILASLNWLMDLGYIEGPGQECDIWLFRKLTYKGVQFVGAVRDPADWARMKEQHRNSEFNETRF